MFLSADHGSYRGIHALMEVAATLADFSTAHRLTARERLAVQGFDGDVPELSTDLGRVSRALHEGMNSVSEKLNIPRRWAMMHKWGRAMNQLAGGSGKQRMH